MFTSINQIPETVDECFALVLNPMSGRVEAKESVGFSTVRQELEDLLASERVPQYYDGRWSKVFKSSGPLEWYNPPEKQWGTGIIRLTARMERVWTAKEVT